MEDIKIVTIEDADYPAALKKISDAPKVLYYRGALPAGNAPRLGVVGTRHPSDYGKEAVLKITGELANAGFIIISGLAPGIDTLAHKIAVEKNCPTIAVLGTGLDEKSIYPASNLALSREIIEKGGCLISEYKPGTPGYPNNFRQRNRIISALSQGVLIIEAKERSGSLITARFAREQGRKLFAIPGPIFALNSQGPNKLIKNGALLVESGDDILKEYHLAPNKKAKKVLGENETESSILDVLKEEALSIDAVIEKTKLPAPLIATTLALMEISGKIRNLGGNVYSLN